MVIEIDIYINIFSTQKKTYHIICKQNKHNLKKKLNLCSNMKTYIISKKKIKEKT
jgi:hypothetical protein